MNSISESKQLSTLEIRQDNAITTARYDYSACQLDILFYLLSKLRKDDEENKVIGAKGGQIGISSL